MGCWLHGPLEDGGTLLAAPLTVHTSIGVLSLGGSIDHQTMAFLAMVDLLVRNGLFEEAGNI